MTVNLSWKKLRHKEARWFQLRLSAKGRLEREFWSTRRLTLCSASRLVLPPKGNAQEGVRRDFTEELTELAQCLHHSGSNQENKIHSKNVKQAEEFNSENG